MSMKRIKGGEGKMEENKKTDFTDWNWDLLIKDRNEMWARMWEEFKADGLEPVNLWPEGAPNYRLAYGQEQPRLLILPAHKDKPRGILIVCAGGAFKFKSPNEAKPVAEFFHAAGLNAAVLDYRVEPYGQLDACEDAKRAIRYLRYKAEELGILADKIAIGGFSAGGMLTGMAATRFDYGIPESEDPIERVSSRPDAAIVCYGAFSPASSVGSGLGYDIKKQNEIARMDNSKNLRYDSPPFFLFQTHQDDPRSVLIMGKELADRGIPFEIHTFQNGPHGGGLYDGKSEDSPYFPHTAKWAHLAVEWLEELGF